MINTCSWVLDNDEPCGELCEGKTMFCGSHNRQLRKEKESERKQLEKRNSLLQKAKSRNLEPRKVISKNPKDWQNTWQLYTTWDSPHRYKGSKVALTDSDTKKGIIKIRVVGLRGLAS